MDIIKQIIPPVHKEGLPFILAAGVITLIIAIISGGLGIFCLAVTFAIALFFRDPDRVTPLSEGYVIAPADGLVSRIEDASPPEELELDAAPCTRVSIFLSVLDVHVNRVPISGKVTKLHYRPGKFINAQLDKASIDNERQAMLITAPNGGEIVFTQIAGLIARRIVCNLTEGQEVLAGQRFGIIRFGSRMDVYLPKGLSPMVCEGQRVVGGETILADLNSKAPARIGIKH